MRRSNILFLILSSCSAFAIALNDVLHSSSEFLLPNDQPVVTLDAKDAFQALNRQQQLYAHYLSQASYYGGLIVLLQTSPESPQIFRLIQRINTAERTIGDLREKAVRAGVNDDEFIAYTVYCSGIYSNMGNYKSFGDSKFVPNITVDKFEAIVKSSSAYSNDRSAMEQIWSLVKGPMYSLTEGEKRLGLAEKGVTTYFSDNCIQEDSDRINRYFKARNMEGYINRAFKTVGPTGKTKYEIRNAAIDSKVVSTEDFEGATFEVTSGDYGSVLKLVNVNLQLAKVYAGNDIEREMISEYVKSFQEGSLDAHKSASRHWIKDKGPAVESYIGFIETYRDPAGQRGEFEGFVAMVNKEESVKFQILVSKAEELLTRLPWPREFEKDTFLQPDFTSLDVLTFAGGMIPAGINIPNYDAIRQSEGFKNVNLGNVVASSYKADKKTTFVSQEDHEILRKWRVASFEVQVGLHELLGHGSGKYFRKENGTLNFPPGLINPVTGNIVDKYYEVGETYETKFTNVASSYEECRADAVGLLLSCYKDVLAIFGHTDSNHDDITYANWLNECHSGLKGLESYSPGTKEWNQAHSQARFVILNVLLEAGQEFLSIKEVTDDFGKPDLLLTIDRTKLEAVGKPALADFLQKLQVFKSTGDVDAARKMYDHYSQVREDGPHPFAKWRDIVVSRKTPRKILVQANTVVRDDKVTLVDYEASPNGMIQSWVDRFPADEFKVIDEHLNELYLKDQPYFPTRV